MRNISTIVRGHYDDDRYMWAIIIRRFCDTDKVLFLPLVWLCLCWPLVERNKYNLRSSWKARVQLVIWNLGPGHLVAEKYLHQAFSSSCWPSAQVEPMLAPPLTLVAWILVQAATRIWFTRFRFYLDGYAMTILRGWWMELLPGHTGQGHQQIGIEIWLGIDPWVQDRPSCPMHRCHAAGVLPTAQVTALTWV
jgi:hypothetical protein